MYYQTYVWTIVTNAIVTSITLYSLVTFVILVRDRHKVSDLFFLDKCADLIIRFAFTVVVYIVVLPGVRQALDDRVAFLSFYIAIIAMAAFSSAYVFSLMLKIGVDSKSAMAINVVAYVAYCLYTLWAFNLEMFNRPNVDWTTSTFQPTTFLQYLNTYLLDTLIITPLLFSFVYYCYLFKQEANQIIRISFVFLLMAIASTALFFTSGFLTTFLKQWDIQYSEELFKNVQMLLGLVSAISSLVHVLGKLVIYRVVKLWHFYRVRLVQKHIFALLGTQPAQLSLWMVVKAPNYYLTEATISIFDSLRLLQKSPDPASQVTYQYLQDAHITDGSLEESIIEIVRVSRHLLSSYFPAVSTNV